MMTGFSFFLVGGRDELEYTQDDLVHHLADQSELATIIKWGNLLLPI
jgi:hypothetical protein